MTSLVSINDNQIYFLLSWEHLFIKHLGMLLFRETSMVLNAPKRKWQPVKPKLLYRVTKYNLQLPDHPKLKQVCVID